MSTYIKETVRPDTLALEPAMWVDDYFGSHHYGVKFSDGKVFDANDFDWKHEKGQETLAIVDRPRVNDDFPQEIKFPESTEQSDEPEDEIIPITKPDKKTAKPKKAATKKVTADKEGCYCHQWLKDFADTRRVFNFGNVSGIDRNKPVELTYEIDNPVKGRPGTEDESPYRKVIITITEKDHEDGEESESSQGSDVEPQSEG